MKKLLKIVGWTAGSLAVLMILLVVGLRLFLPAEKLRDLAVARASAALGREVAVADVRVSLRGGLGVQLTGVSIGNPAGFPPGRLLTAESVDLKLRLRPLLSRQVHADRLVINNPDISLIKLAAGRNNFSFAAAKSGGPAAGGASDADGGAVLNLERFEVVGGAVSFRDAEANTGLDLAGVRLDWTVTADGGGQLVSSGETLADSMKVTGQQVLAVGPVSLRHAAGIDTRGEQFVLKQSRLSVAGLEFTVTAEVAYGRKSPVTRAEIVGDALDLGAVLALLPAGKTSGLGPVKAAGTLGLRTNLTFGQLPDEPLSVQGSLELTGGRLELPRLQEPITDLAASATFDLDTLRVAACKARTSGADLAFRGTVTGLKQPAEAKIEGTLSLAADLAGLQGFLPPEREAALAGKAAGSARLAGRLDSPRDLLAGGELTVTDLSYRDANIFEPVTDLDAVMVLGPRDVTIKSCRVKLQPSDFTFSGVVRGLLTALMDKTAAPPRLEFTLEAPLFNADHLFPAASPGATPRGAAAEAARSPVIPEFPNFTGSGKVAIANLIYGGVNFTGITGKVAIADRTVTITEVVGAAFAGRVTGQSAVDLKDMKTPGYRGNFAAVGIQADSLLTRFTPLHGHLFGMLDFTGTFSAAGKDPAAFRKSLTLDATSGLTQGRLKTDGVVQQGLRTLAASMGRTAQPEEQLRDLAGVVKVAGERVLLERFASEIPGLGSLTLGGGYGFAGDLDFQGSLLLTQENSSKLLGGTGGLAGTLGNLLGKKDQPVQRLPLPVKIGGTWTKPDVVIDFAALTKSAGEDITRELKGKLEGMFRK